MKSLGGIAFVCLAFVLVCSITSGQATRPTATGASTAPASVPATGPADPLASPEALADFLGGSNRPADPQANAAAWAKLSADQQAQAEKAYQKLFQAWVKSSDCRGKEVMWVVGHRAIRPLEDGDKKYRLIGASTFGYTVAAELSADQRKALKVPERYPQDVSDSLDKGPHVEITGTIKDYVFAQGRVGPKFMGVGVNVDGFAVFLSDVKVSVTDKPITEPDLARIGPLTMMLGVRGKAHHVVYLIDRSGSMLATFDLVRTAMLDSISKLSDKQDFHIIFFSSGAPKENTPNELTPGGAKEKAAAGEYLKDRSLSPSGQTNPSPALIRAFDVLARADASTGKTIYLLTDGVFPDNKKILEIIDSRNAKKDVTINTFLLGEVPPEAEEVMQKIAKDSGGMYKAISAEE